MCTAGYASVFLLYNLYSACGQQPSLEQGILHGCIEKCSEEEDCGKCLQAILDCLCPKLIQAFEKAVVELSSQFSTILLK